MNDLLNEYVSLLIEGERHIVDVYVTIRVYLERDHPSEPGATQKLNDIFIDIRATDGVVSLNQLGPLSDLDMNGRRYIRLNLRYRDDKNRTAEKVAADLKAVNGIEKVHIYGFGREEVDIKV